MDRIKNRWAALLICFGLTAVTMAAFWPVTRNGFLSFDDAEYVTENPHVLHGLTVPDVKWAFQAGYASNWHPLTWISHMLDVQMFGLNAGRHHLINLLLHVANACLLFLFMRRVTGAVWRSALVAALFALHPLHVESVAWIAERKDVLSTFFFLLTLIAYAKYAGARRIPGQLTSDSPLTGPLINGPSLITDYFWLSLALVFFALGLMSKPMLVTVPFLLLVLDVWPLERVRISDFGFQNGKWLKLIMEKVPFLVLALGSCVITYLAQDIGQSVSTIEGLPLHARLSNAVVSYFRYIGKMFWPMDLAVFYPHPGVKGPAGEFPVWLVGLAVIAFVFISAFAFRRLRREPWFATGWFWFIGMLVPVIGLVQVGGQAMADRYTYLPLIGLFICVVWAAADLVLRARIPVATATTAALAALAACAVLAHRQAGFWKDDLALFSHALKVTKDNSVAHYTVGLVNARRGNYAEAMAHFQAALAADPNSPFAYYSMAVALGEQGKIDEAIADYREAIRLRPRMDTAHNNLGALLWRLGRRDEAIAEYQETLRLEPAAYEAHFNLGNAWVERGKLDEATKEFQEAIRLKPDYGEALTALAKTLIRQGKPDAAQAPLREVVRLNPKNAGTHVNLGELLTVLGKRDEAITEFREAVRLDPKYADAYLKLGNALIEQGKTTEATTEFRQAVAVQPDFVPGLSSLGRVLAMSGKLEEAEPQFQKAVRLAPTNAEARVDLGNALQVLGRTNEASESFAAAVRLDPELARKNLEAGQALMDRGELVLAVGRVSTALNLAPTNRAAHALMGLLLARQNKLDLAIREFEEAIRLQPTTEAYCDLALAHRLQGKPNEAISNYEAALRLNPDSTTALNDLAWLLATDRNSEVRNGPKAVQLAQHACRVDGGGEARFWGTLDAAYAEAGRFDDAIATAQKAREKALAAAQADVAKAAETRLALYRNRQAYHE